jgi:hypothetical protein
MDTNTQKETSPLYYAWGRDSYIPGRWTDDCSLPDSVRDVFWITGAWIDAPIPKPIHAKLDPIEAGMADHMPEYMNCDMPIFRDDLLEALDEAGVDNLQLFDLVITDPENGKEYTNYKAVNILGLIQAADMKKSVATVHTGGPIIDVDFDKLVLDETAPEGAYMFRLAESVNTVLVHRDVKEYLEKKGFTGLEFYEVGDIAT